MQRSKGALLLSAPSHRNMEEHGHRFGLKESRDRVMCPVNASCRVYFATGGVCGARLVASKGVRNAIVTCSSKSEAGIRDGSLGHPQVVARVVHVRLVSCHLHALTSLNHNLEQGDMNLLVQTYSCRDSVQRDREQWMEPFANIDNGAFHRVMQSEILIKP